MEQRFYRVADLEGCSQTRFLRSILEAEGWARTDSDGWDLFWSFELHEHEVFRSLAEGQRVNHFPGIASIVLKDELHYYLAAAARRMEGLGLSSRLDYFPTVYSMAKDHDKFVEAARKDPEKLWLLKPRRLSGGRGIEMITDPSEVQRGEEWLVQQYIADPLLFPDRAHKHVLRVYLLLTSLDPLVLYMHSMGSVRYASQPYRRAPESLSDPFVHFLNGHLHWRSADNPIGTEGFETYRARLRTLGIDDRALWAEIRRLAILTAIVHREPILGASLSRTERLGQCFELLGLDVLVDADSKPWLIECNMSPALDLSAPAGSPDLQAQRQARETVVRDMLRLLGITGPHSAIDGLERFDAEMHCRGGFDRIFPAEDSAAFLPFFQIARGSDLALMRSST